MEGAIKGGGAAEGPGPGVEPGSPPEASEAAINTTRSNIKNTFRAASGASGPARSPKKES